ncbi:TPA: S8 family serine peptidase [Streptococcus suis]|uniref:S8 family serine peptidase n=1 Tax=Streptococcus suis TaxID=1307 RepID=UPI0006B413BE|nr:S8 family serine peptidase [Streptococcus suis]KPA59769.1 serine protease [Streptococcus suis]MBS0705844.1 S8 family serine peptidase [Streptococcus suis]MCK3997015.1 S8 family serine peptidase [Streptococcus suis]QLL48095.1 YSIRK-type signal peptide-containing protein [Streptococcus suis]HEL2707402.1 S8 family serine peptidase [Streptococcus suis]
MKQKWSQIENKQRFSIKKLSVGVASVSIGFFITGVPMVQADTSGEGLESTVAVATDMDSRQNSAVEKKEDGPLSDEPVKTEQVDEPVAEEGVVEEVVDTEAGEESGLLTDQAATEIKTTAGKTTDESKEKEDISGKEASAPQTIPQESQLEPEEVTRGRYILQFSEENRNLVLDKLKKIDGVKIVHEYKEVLTGASVEVGKESLSDVKAITELTSLEESRRIRPTLHTAKQLVGALKASSKYQTDGRGMVIAVIDSGLDIKHKDMRLDDGVIPKIKDITPSTTGTYTLKVPHGYNYVSGNDNLYDDTHEPHGMHIAGTLAGNATDEEVASKKGVDGIAPNAQLLVYKIFSNDPKNYKAETEDAAYAAIEDAIKHGADVISLSVGYYDSGLPGNAYYTIAKRAAEKGIIITAAIGNAGASSSDTSFDLHTNNALGAVDTATTVGVAATPAVIAVGSARNTHLVQREFMLNGQSFGYYPIGYTTLTEGKYEFVDAGNGHWEEVQGLDLAGKVAVIKKDKFDLKDAVRNLKFKDVAGIIVINTDQGWNKDYYRTHQLLVDDKTLLSYSSIWGISLSGEDGRRLLEVANQSQGNTGLVLKPTIGMKKLIEVPTVSGFSSWGPTVNLELKPEIVAPGEDVYATLNDNRYGSMSGTSMASPIVAGASALLLPRIRQMTPPEGMTRMDLLRIILMNTATPLVDVLDSSGHALENSPRQQGAGLLQIDRAFETDVILHHRLKGGVELKEIGRETEFEVTLENLGNQQRSFAISAGKVLTSQDVPVDRIGRSGKVVKEIHATEIKGSSIHLSEQSIQLGPKEKRTIRLKLDAGEAKDQFAEGYIYFKSLTDGQSDISIPYFGFVGDWSKERIVDAPAWETSSKLKLTSVLSSYKHNKSGRYIELGREKIQDNQSPLNPDNIAIQNQHSDSQIGNAFVRFALLRDITNYDLDIVKEATEDAPVLRRIDTGTMLSRVRYVDYFESLSEYFKLRTPIELHRWDGKVYDASKDENIPAPEGQYFFRLRVKNKENGAYQYTYLPVKIDNQKPEIVAIDTNRLTSHRELVVTAKDNNKVWEVRANLNGEDLLVEKVVDDAGQLHYHLKEVELPLDAKNHLRVEVMDIAGNVVAVEKDLVAPVIQFKNLEDLMAIRSKKTVEIKANVSAQVSNVQANLDAQAVNYSLENGQLSLQIPEQSDGRHSFELILKDKDGKLIYTKTLNYLVDNEKPTIDLDIEKDEEVIQIGKNGRFTLKGKVSDNVSLPKNIKLYYSNLDIGKGELKIIDVKEDGSFEQDFFKSDFPRAIMLTAVDEKGNKLKDLRINTSPESLDEEEETEVPITVNNWLIDPIRFNKESLGRELDSGLVDFKKQEDGTYLFTFEIEAETDQAHSVRINGGEKRYFEDGKLTYPVTLIEEGNVVDISVYNEADELTYTKKYQMLVDTENPVLQLENEVLPLERQVVDSEEDEDEENQYAGVLLADADGHLTLTGSAKDNGIYWSLKINEDFVARGGFWRQYGNNEKAFRYELHSLKDGDTVKLDLSDSFGNALVKKYKVRLNDKEVSEQVPEKDLHVEQSDKDQAPSIPVPKSEAHVPMPKEENSLAPQTESTEIALLTGDTREDGVEHLVRFTKHEEALGISDERIEVSVPHREFFERSGRGETGALAADTSGKLPQTGDSLGSVFISALLGLFGGAMVLGNLKRKE